MSYALFFWVPAALAVTGRTVCHGAGALDGALGNFAAVLTTDQLDHSHPLLEAITGRSLPAVPRTNVNRKRPGLDGIDPRVLSRIRELNRLDVRLYELAQEASGARTAAALS